jgi:hypothetical protein
MRIPLNFTSALVFGGLLLLGASTTSLAQTQTCIDNAVIACFDGCNDPLNFQECLVGCAIGASSSLQYCSEQCFNNPTCLSNCEKSVRSIANCAYVSGDLTALCGTVVLNRATGFWQQTVRVTNTNTSVAMNNVAFVLDSLASGWTLLNGDGVTADMPPAGNSYKNLGSLAPGASVTVTLQFKRTGTLTFGYITRVLTGLHR